MAANPQKPSVLSAAKPAAKVLVATTAMLAFISYWRAAAIVLNDLGSSAFYAGAIAEHFIGKTAPWFVLAIMLFAFAVQALYFESCGMFVRGGVYRVVKEGMGATLAKFSVSALMFDYILTGPISGVSAGLYLVGLLNELLHYAHMNIVLPVNATAAVFAIDRDDLFLVGKRQGHPGIQRESAADHVRHHDHGDHADRLVRLHADRARHSSSAVSATCESALTRTMRSAGCATPSLPYTIGLIGILIGLGHSVLAMSGEETHGAGVSRNRASQAAQSEKSGLGDFSLQPDFYGGRRVFRGDDYPGLGAHKFFGQPDQRTGDVPGGTAFGAAGFPGFRRDRGRADAGRAR